MRVCHCRISEDMDSIRGYRVPCRRQRAGLLVMGMGSRQRTLPILGDQNAFPLIEETLQASHGIRLHFDNRWFALEQLVLCQSLHVL